MRYFTYLKYRVFETHPVYYTDITSQFGLVPFQMLSNHTGPVATILDGTDFDHNLAECLLTGLEIASAFLLLEAMLCKTFLCLSTSPMHVIISVG